MFMCVTVIDFTLRSMILQLQEKSTQNHSSLLLISVSASAFLGPRFDFLLQAGLLIKLFVFS